jgi:uncharacterized lipoprotein YddW (UPF0748 family)
MSVPIKNFLLLALILMTSSIQTHAEEAPRRALFISVIEKNPVLESRANIEKVVDFAAKAGIKVLFVQIYRANQAWFPSKMAVDGAPYERCLKSVGEDAFALLIKEAQAKGIEVHAWLNLLSLAKNDKAPIFKKYGTSILTRNSLPKKNLQDYKIDEQYFLEPGDPRVRQELGIMVEEIAKNYPDLDGIQFDYIRYPDKKPAYGYTTANLTRFRKATGKAVADEKDPVWREWKRDQVTLLVRHLAKRIHAIQPKIHITTTGCMPYIRAYDEAFQDWPLWVKDGLVEYVTVMSYPDTADEFQKNITDAKERVPDLKKVYFALGAYKFLNDPVSFERVFDMCNTSASGGCAVFYYGNLVDKPELTAPLLKGK